MGDNKYGYVKGDKVFRKAFLDFPDREIGEVKESEEQAIKYFEDRFEQASAEVSKVKAKIDATENKGSYLMKVLHLKDTLCDFDAIGDFEALYKVLNALHAELQTVIDANRHQNLQIKTALLEQLEAFAKSSDWKAASLSIKEIQVKWVKTGAVAEESRESIEGRFKTLVDSFYERRNSFYEDLNLMMAQKEEDFKAFIKQVAFKLEKIDSPKILLAEIKNTVERWKELGKLERTKHNQYWEELQAIFKSNTQRAKKADAKIKKRSSKEVIDQKQKLIDQLGDAAKAVVPEIDLKSIKESWRKSGRLSKSQDHEFNQKYRFLMDMISEKQFLNQLFLKKAKSTHTDAEKNKLRVRLMYDLLKRDQTELHNFEENLGKFNTSSDLNEVLMAKLDHQKRKVEVKKEIINELKRLY